MSEQGGDDDFSGLTSFFFYMFIVHPITAWILRPGRFERKKSIMYAIGFLAVLAAVKTGECCWGEKGRRILFERRNWECWPHRARSGCRDTSCRESAVG